MLNECVLCNRLLLEMIKYQNKVKFLITPKTFIAHD